MSALSMSFCRQFSGSKCKRVNVYKWLFNFWIEVSSCTNPTCLQNKLFSGQASIEAAIPGWRRRVRLPHDRHQRRDRGRRPGHLQERRNLVCHLRKAKKFWYIETIQRSNLELTFSLEAINTIISWKAMPGSFSILILKALHLVLFGSLWSKANLRGQLS